MNQCGFCSMLSSLLRRAMCVGSRRGSSESYYRELGDQDTLKIEDKTSDRDDETEDMIAEVEPEPGPPDIDSEICAMVANHICVGRFFTIHKRRKKRLLTRSLNQENALLDDIQFGQVQCILNQSVQWRFNAFTLETVSGGRCLPVLCVHLFHVYGLLSHFKLDAVKAWKLFSLIEEGYHSTNPYHNAIHAADVTQAMHCFLSQARIREHMTPQEILASLLAAIAHDMDHPGVNQPFLIATSNHLAALYRNTSVLENHHWRSAISCLIESDVLGEGSALQAPLEAQISSLILATDITRQQEYLSRFKGHLDTNTLDMTKKEHRHLVLQIALKCADISNPCRPWEISRKWSLKVCEEFFRQGDYERQLNLPVTPLCDRYNTSIPKIQTGFFMYVVTPLISEWHRFLHNDLSTQMLKNLLYNQKKWESLLEQEEAEENGTEIPIPEDETPEEESEPALSDSSEMLLPRRSSLNPTQVKQNGLKDQLRRFSVPLNMRSEKLKRGSLAAAEGITPCESEHSLHCDASDKVEKVLSTENLLPNTTIASITTPKQATRLNTVFKDGCTWKLVRQQTFPPLDPHARLHGYFSREHQDKSDEPVLCSRFRSEAWLNDGKTDGKSDDRLKDFKKKETEKTESDGSPTNGTSSAEASPARRKENWIPIVKPLGAIRRESVAVGSQLRDNITSFQLGAPYDALCRRKSMPADTITLPATLKESLMCEMAEVLSLPQFLRRTLSNKDALTRRRGSAPAPIAVSDLGLLALASRSSNGGRRKPPVGPVGPVACQVWASRGAGGYPPERVPRLPRRSSLPVEVLTGI